VAVAEGVALSLDGAEVGRALTLDHYCDAQAPARDRDVSALRYRATEESVAVLAALFTLATPLLAIPRSTRRGVHCGSSR